MGARVALWLEEEDRGEWFVVVSAPGIEIDRIGPYSRPEADAFIAGAKTFAPSYIGARPVHVPHVTYPPESEHDRPVVSKRE